MSIANSGKLIMGAKFLLGVINFLGLSLYLLHKK